MAEYKIGTLSTYVILDPIIDWTRMRVHKPFIKNLIKKSSGLVDPNLWVLQPRMHSVECRMSDNDKSTMETINADKNNTQTLFIDDVVQYDVWFTNVEYMYEREINEAQPWDVTIEFIEIPIPAFTAYLSVVPLTGAAPLDVNVYADVYGGTPPYTYDWDWGDNTTHGTSQIDSHTYTDSGTYNGSCTIDDDASQQIVRYFTVVVTPQGDIYKTVNIYYESARNSVGARPPELTVNIQKSVAKNSIGARPPAQTVNITYPVDTESRDKIAGVATGGHKVDITINRDTEVRDKIAGVATGGHKVDITYTMSRDVNPP